MRSDIRAMARRIVELFQPERIILFGSHARGDASPDSDVDLLVVMETTATRRETAIKIGVALHDFETAKDVIVVHPKDFAWRQNVTGTLEWPASREGKVLYSRP